jgi:hypothetical protein
MPERLSYGLDEIFFIAVSTIIAVAANNQGKQDRMQGRQYMLTR